MGNRAIITNKEKNIGMYLHWNGGRDSVEAFLEYCRLKGYRSPDEDGSYAFARLVQVASNYFGGSLNVGVLDNIGDSIEWDNGNYIVGKDWKIIDREYPYEDFEEQNEYDLNEMLIEIDKAQPIKEQLGEILFAKEKEVSNLKKGDRVYIQDYNGRYEKYEVAGFGKDRIVNGTNVFGKPYVKKYGETRKDYEENINNYVLTEKIKVCENDKSIKKDKALEMEV